MNAVLSRKYSHVSTTGRMVVFDGDKVVMQCVTIELPDNGNQVGSSCILEGTYDVHKTYSPKHGKCFEVQNVPGRTAILIHRGNFTSDTRGCILPGTYFTDINDDGNIDVGDSTSALNKMLNLLPDSFKLYII